MAKTVDFTLCALRLDKKRSLKQGFLTDKTIFPGDLPHSYLHSWRTPRSQPAGRPGRPESAPPSPRHGLVFRALTGCSGDQVLSIINSMNMCRGTNSRQEKRQQAPGPWGGTDRAASAKQQL